MLLEIEDVRDVRPAPGVDRLVRIADHRQAAMRLRDRARDHELRVVGVLVFVDEHVPIALLQLLAHRRILADQPCHPQEEIVEVDRIALGELGFIGAVDLRERTTREVAGLRRVGRSIEELVLGIADAREHQRRGPVLGVESSRGDRSFRRIARIVGVEDREARRERRAVARGGCGARSVSTQERGTEGVERADLQAARTRELRIEINPQNGAIRAMAKLIVADKVTNPHDEILLSKARAIKSDAQPGEEIEVEVTPRDFGRIAAQAARQAINQRLRQIEREMIYDEFKDRAGEIVTGTVRRFERSDVIVDLGKFEGVMPSRERVLTEEYNVGDRLRAYVVAVESGNRGPEIILSRSHPNFVRRLFELEVSEIADRTVELKVLAREAGFRTKVAVHSADPKVDPVGACVGMRGARVKNIVRELNNEKVDIIRWDADPLKFVSAALKPANIKSITADEAKKTIQVLVPKEDLSVAIGRKGQNARLTAKMCGWEVDIQEDKREEKALKHKTDEAAHSLAGILGISEEDALKLTAGGMNSIEVIQLAGAEDIADALGSDIETGQRILEAAQATQKTPAA